MYCLKGEKKNTHTQAEERDITKQEKENVPIVWSAKILDSFNKTGRKSESEVSQLRLTLQPCGL